MTSFVDDQSTGARPVDDAGFDEVFLRLKGARPAGTAKLSGRLAKNLLIGRILGNGGPSLGRYELQEQVGSGGLGVVFRAWDPLLERHVAIKVLASHSAPEKNQAIISEARVLAKLTHPYILTVHDMGAMDGQIWIAMELVTQGNLRQWVARRQPDWRALVWRFVEAARGLEAAHLAGLVHRDIKPENLLVGEDGRTRVADFGLAVRSDSASGERLAGTPVYLPPEARSGGSPNAKWDQYSACFSMHELLAMIATDGDIRVPAQLVSILQRGIADEPNDRWPSMDALADALESLVARPTTDARRRMLLERVERMWITGVLDTSLAQRRLFDVRVSVVPSAVDGPWDDLTTKPPTLTSILGISRAFEAAHRGILLLGCAGAGKTTAMLIAARDMLRDAFDDSSAPIPIVLNLSSFSPELGTLADWVRDELSTKYGLARQFADSLLQAGHGLSLLLDGLDEVSADHRVECVNAINSFRKESGVGLLVACRDEVYRSISCKLLLGLALQLEPLESIATLGSKDSAPGSVRGERLLRTPLLHVLAQESHLPGADPGALFRAYVERALVRKPVLLQTQQKELIAQVTWLARAMQRVGASDIWLERMQADWLPSRGQRVLAQLLGLGLIIGVLIGGNIAAAALLERPLFMGLIFGAPMVLPVLWYNGGLRIRPKQALQWSAVAAVRRGLFLTLCTTSVGILFGLQFRMAPSVIMGFVGGIVSSAMTGFVPKDTDAATTPGEGFRQSARNGVRFAIPIGAFVGAFMGFVVVPLLKAHPELGTLLRTNPTIERLLAVQIGTVSILTGVLIWGGTPVLLHIALRCVLAACSPLPLRLEPVLNAAADRGLLRRVGGGWMFQHKLLLDHLAASGESIDKANRLALAFSRSTHQVAPAPIAALPR